MSLIRKPKKPVVAALAGIALIVALAVVLTGLGSVVSRPMIEAQLKALNERVEQEARAGGGEASFTYESVDTRGFLFGQYAIIRKPTLTYSTRDAFTKHTTTLSTERAIAKAGKISGLNLRVEMPDPLVLSGDAAEKTQIVFPRAPIYTLARKPSPNVALKQELHLPPQFTIQPLNAQGAPQEGNAVTVSYAEKPVISMLTHNDGAIESTLRMQNVRIAKAGDPNELTIGAVESLQKQMLKPDGRRGFDIALSMNDIGIKAEPFENTPFTLKISAEGSALPASAGTPAAMQPRDMELKLREISLGTQHFNIKATGAVNQKPDDPLPYGAVDVGVDHFSAFLQSQFIKPEYRPALIAVMTAVTGQPAENADAVNFTVKREKLGTTMIGQVTLEQLMAYLLPQMMQPGAVQPPPPQPQAPAPGAAPVAPVIPSPLAPQ